METRIIPIRASGIRINNKRDRFAITWDRNYNLGLILLFLVNIYSSKITATSVNTTIDII